MSSAAGQANIGLPGQPKGGTEIFLGSDARGYDEIIAGDNAALAAAGISRHALVRRLRDLYDAAVAAFGAPVNAGPDVAATWHESKGTIRCPFGDLGGFDKGEVVIRDRVSGSALVVTQLGLHLIEAHSFHQGRGSRYRIDPQTATRLLSLTPDSP